MTPKRSNRPQPLAKALLRKAGLVLLPALSCSSGAGSEGDASGAAGETGSEHREFIDSLGIVCRTVRACYPEQPESPARCRGPVDGEASAHWTDYEPIRDVVERCLNAVEDREGLGEWSACIVAGTNITVECLQTCPANVEDCVHTGNAALEPCTESSAVGAEIDACIRRETRD